MDTVDLNDYVSSLTSDLWTLAKKKSNDLQMFTENRNQNINLGLLVMCIDYISQASITTTVLFDESNNVSLKDYLNIATLANEITQQCYKPTFVSDSTNISSINCGKCYMYTISFDKQGHGIDEPNMKFGTIPVSALPVEATDGDYGFLGWSLTPTGSVLTGTFTPTGNTTLYAIWALAPNVQTSNATVIEGELLSFGTTILNYQTPGILAEITSMGVNYSTNPNPLIDSTTLSAEEGTESIEFGVDFYPPYNFYYQSFATTASKTYYGEIKHVEHS